MAKGVFMNYEKIYLDLVTRAKDRVLESYAEKHHIKPRCMGGGDEIENLVALTPEEHYVAHMLLVKIYPGNKKLIFAANMMANRNNKAYGWIKRKFAIEIKKQNKGQQLTEEQYQKLLRNVKGKKKTEEHKEAIRKAKLKQIEYKGSIYTGYDELLEKTGVSRHLYLKHYVYGRDPEPFIGNKTYGMIERNKVSPSRSSVGKKWYNNGIEERYSIIPINGWVKGRIKRVTTCYNCGKDVVNANFKRHTSKCTNKRAD